MIELRHISFSYNSQPILFNFNLSLLGAKSTVLIGPSGCGKSTILKLINGLISAQKGDVLIDQQAVTQSNVISIRRKMGYLIQQGGLFPNMTAKQNITLMARRLKWTSSKINNRLNELAELTRIDSELLSRFPNNLSGGQQQRVSLMRALMLDPDILLLDEPFAALDPLTKNELQKNMLAIFKKLSKSVLLVTHDLNEAAFFADRIILLRQGQIIQEGSIDDLVNKPQNNFVEQFVSAQRSYLPGFTK